MSYAKADPTDILMSIHVTNAASNTELLHVLPTLWFRNTWSWDVGTAAPTLAATGDGVVAVDHPFLGELEFLAGRAPDGGAPQLLFCDNETNQSRLYGVSTSGMWPKDGVNDHVVSGAESVNPARQGSKCAAWYQIRVDPGETAELRLRLCPAGSQPDRATALGGDFTRVVGQRRGEADEFYGELTPAQASDDEAAVMRQAFAGMLWSKQFYNYDVARWLDGDPAQPPPPVQRRLGRNARWRSFQAFDVMSMPDTWEYPWFAAWDLAFHCVALVHIDPAFAKYQLLLLCREWFQHPTGAVPAYEWDFGDVNPPVLAWAALEVFGIDGGRDMDFLSRIFDKLLVNFTWWVNREDTNGSNLFEGGFMGLDNIGPLDRSHLPVRGILEQSDATGWMAAYALSMATMAGILHGLRQRPALDLVQKFLEHFAAIADALETSGVWDERDGMYYDRIVLTDGSVVPVRVRSMVAMIPTLAAAVVNEEATDETLITDKRFAEYLRRHGLGGTEEMAAAGILRGDVGKRRLLVGVTGIDRLRRLCRTLFDPDEFLSPHGLRSLSAVHREHRYVLDVEGVHADIDYEPAESTTAMFGGNSNWRGPVWFPLNYLVATALERYHEFFGADLTVEYPTGIRDRRDARQGRRRSVAANGVDLRRRSRRTAAVLRRGRTDADRPSVAQQSAVLRVLSRRQWGRLGRVPPDRVDRTGGRCDPPSPSGVSDGVGGHPAACITDGDMMTLKVVPGQPNPLGATSDSRGTNFAVASGGDAVTLCLFDADGAETQLVLPDRDGDVWHGFVAGVGPGQAYGYRVSGPFDPARGLRYNPAKLLLDPYAHAIDVFPESVPQRTVAKCASGCAN